ncbi:MAG TPA: protein kinase [Planctomycetota bacterium]|nr:protein kinase [Planctomycetota bacterium]
MPPDPSTDTPTPLAAIERTLAARLDGRTPADAAALPPDVAAQLDDVLATHALLHPGARGDAVPGSCLGPYRLLEPLGRGGQGSVWLADDRRLGRRVAIKILDHLPTDAAALARFRREAAMAARLDHPGICSVFDIGSADGAAFIAMRYVPGPTLAQARRDGRGAGVDWLAVIEQSACALHALHAAGIVHRDLKPSNIVLAAGDQPVLLDFGLAQDIADDAMLTRTGTVLGTPAYLAPERLSPSFGPVDARSDIWSLAATGFELITGAPPFAAPTREGLHHAILTLSPGHHLPRLPRLPRAVRQVFAVALSKRSKDRYATALAFADDLRRARLGQPLSARAARPWFRWWRLIVQHRFAVGAVAGIIAALLVGRIVALQSLSTTNQALQRADGLRQLAEAQLLVRRDPAAALTAALAGAAAAPAPVVNDTLLAILPQVRQVWQQALGPTLDLAFGLAGDELVTAGADGVLRSFALDSPSPRQSHRLGAAAVQLALGPAGRTLAVLTADGAVALLDAALRELGTLPPGAAPTTAIANAGDLWLLGDRDGWLRAVALPMGSESWRRQLHRTAVARITCSADGATFASADSRGDVRIGHRDGSDGPRWQGVGTIHALQLNADGTRLLAADDDNTAHVFDCTSGRELQSLRGHESSVLGATFTADGRHIATASFDRSVRLWDASDGRLETILAGHQRAVRCVAFAPDGCHLASAGDDDTVRIFRRTPPPGFAVLPHGPWATMAARFDADGRRLVTTAASNTAKVWDVGTGALLREVDHGAPICCSIFDDARRRLITAGRDGAILATDLDSGNSDALHRLPVGREDQVHLQLDHRGARLLATTANGRARLLDAATGALQHELRGLAPMHRTGIVARCAFTADDRFVITVPPDDGGCTITIIDTGNGAVVATSRGHRGMVTSVDATDTCIASTSVDGTARLWRLDGGALFTWIQGKDAIQQVRFDAGGHRVLTCGGDCMARIFDCTDGRELAVLRGHDGMLYCGSFSPDGTRAITGSWDGTAAIWDAHSGERLVHQTAHTRPVFSALFSPDGATAATTSLDGTARLWPVDPLAFARRQVR